MLRTLHAAATFTGAALLIVGTQFSTASAFADPTDSPSRIGLHCVGGSADLARETNATFIRVIIHWADLEPAPGRYNFEPVDAAMEYFAERELDFIPTLRANADNYCRIPLNSPSIGAPNSARPRDMQQWLDYVGAFVERYDGDGRGDMPGLTRPIRYWQVENEWLQMWVDTDDALHEFVRLTTARIRQADPEAGVVSPAFNELRRFAVADGIDPAERLRVGSPLPPFAPQYVTRQQLEMMKYNQGSSYHRARRFLRETAEIFDAIDVHLYTTELNEIGYALDWMTQAMREEGVDRPLWSLEFGAPYYDLTELTHCERMAPSLAVAFAHGVERIALASLIPPGNPNFVHLSLVERENLRRKSSYFNFQRAVEAIDGFDRMESETGGDRHVYRFFRADGSVGVIAWSTDGSASTDLPASGPGTVYRMLTPGAPPESAGPEVVEPRNGSITVEFNAAPVIALAPPGSALDGSGDPASPTSGDPSSGRIVRKESSPSGNNKSSMSLVVHKSSDDRSAAREQRRLARLLKKQLRIERRLQRQAERELRRAELRARREARRAERRAQREQRRLEREAAKTPG